MVVVVPSVPVNLKYVADWDVARMGSYPVVAHQTMDAAVHHYRLPHYPESVEADVRFANGAVCSVHFLQECLKALAAICPDGQQHEYSVVHYPLASSMDCTETVSGSAAIAVLSPAGHCEKWNGHSRDIGFC